MRNTAKRLLSGIMAFVMILSVTASPLYDVLNYFGVPSAFAAGAEEITVSDSETQDAVSWPQFGPQVRRIHTYLIKVVDQDNNPISGAKVEWSEMSNSYSTVTGSGGEATVKSVYWPSVKVFAQGYESVSVNDITKEDQVTVIRMNSASYSIDNVYYSDTEDGNGVDVLNSAHTINRQITVLNPTYYDIFLRVSTSGTEAKNFMVYCDNKLISSTKENNIRINTESISGGGKLSVEVEFKDGYKLEKPIYLKVKDNSSELDFKLDVGSLDITLPDEYSWLGSLSLSLPEFPVYASYVNDEVRVAVGVNKDVMKEDSKWNGFTNSLEDWLEDVDNGLTGLAAMRSKETWTNYVNSQSNSNVPGIPVKCKVNIAGYGSAKIDTAGRALNAISVKVVLSIDVCVNHSWQTLIWVIPFVFDISAGVNVSTVAELKISDFGEDTKVSGSFDLKIKPYVKFFAGVGLKKVASLGIYGGASLPVSICIYNDDASKVGLNTIDLTGELGIQASFLFFKYTKQLLSGEYNIYTRKNYIAKTIAVRDEVAYTTPCSFERDTLESMLNADNYSATQSSNDQLSLNDNEQGVIAENVSPFSDADVLVDGDTTIIAAVNTDTSRGINNQTYIVTSVYSEGKWSETTAVNNSGYAEFSPRLYKKGEDIFLIYQQATEIFGDDADANKVTGSVGIALSRLDKETMTFGETELIYGADGYNFSLATDKGYSVWYHNMDGDPFGNTNNNNIVLFDGEESKVIKEGLPHILALRIGNISGETYIAYTLEGDGNYETNGDTKLYLLDVNGGEPVLVSEGNIETVQFTDYNNGMLVWQNGTRLYSVAAAGESPTEFAQEEISNLFCVLDDGSICYVGKPDPEGDSVFYVMARHGEKLTAPFEYDTVSENIGRMIVRDNTILCNLSDGEQSFEICNLYLKTIKEKSDIRVDYVDVDAYDLLENSDIPMDVYLTNNGSDDVDMILFSFTDENGNNIGSHLLEDADLETGESQEFTISVSDSANIVGEKFYVTAEEISETNDIEPSDDSPENNKHPVDFSTTAIRVYIDDYKSDKENLLYVMIKNENHVPASGTINVSDSKGSVIYTEAFENLTAEDMIFFDLDEEKIIGKEDLSKMVTVTVETTHGNDNLMHNNTQTHYIGTECLVQLYGTEYDEDSVILTWDEVSDIYGVEIEQLIDGNWKEIAELDDASAGTYTVDGLEASDEWSFRIILTKKDGYEIQRSECSNIVEVKEVQEDSNPETDVPETDVSETDDPETDDPETDDPETDDPVKPAPDTGAEGMAVAASVIFALTGIAILSKKRR